MSGELAVFNRYNRRGYDFEVDLLGAWQTRPFVYLLDLNGDLIANLQRPELLHGYLRGAIVFRDEQVVRNRRILPFALP